MKTSFKSVYAIITAAFTVVIAALRTLITSTYTEAEGVYAQGKSLPLIFDIVVFAVILMLAVLPFFIKDRSYDTSYSKVTAFTSALSGFVFIAVSVTTLLSASGSTAMLVMGITGILAGFGLLMNLFTPDKYTVLRAVLSFAPVIYSLAGLIEVYFDMSILITSPNRVYAQVSFLAMAVFFLTCSREHLNMPDHRFFYIGASAASVLTATYALPNLIAGDILAKGTSLRPEQFVLMLAVCVYALSKLLTAAFKK